MTATETKHFTRPGMYEGMPVSFHGSNEAGYVMANETGEIFYEGTRKNALAYIRRHKLTLAPAPVVDNEAADDADLNAVHADELVAAIEAGKVISEQTEMLAHEAPPVVDPWPADQPAPTGFAPIAWQHLKGGPWTNVHLFTADDRSKSLCGVKLPFAVHSSSAISLKWGPCKRCMKVAAKLASK